MFMEKDSKKVEFCTVADLVTSDTLGYMGKCQNHEASHMKQIWVQPEGILNIKIHKRNYAKLDCSSECLK